MRNINKILVPTSIGEGVGHLYYHDGNVVRYEHGNIVNVYLFHETIDGNTYAMEITMDYPVTRSKCINAAEMAIYGLKNAMDVASFNASLARKARNHEEIEEVKEHDELINQIKTELNHLEIFN